MAKTKSFGRSFFIEGDFEGTVINKKIFNIKTLNIFRIRYNINISHLRIKIYYIKNEIQSKIKNLIVIFRVYMIILKYKRKKRML